MAGIATCSLLAFSVWLAPGLDTPEPVDPFLNGAFPSSLPVTLELAESEETAITALAMAAEPRGERLFVAEQSGTIYTFLPTEDGLKEKTFFMNMTQQVWAGQDSGVLGLAFHPEYNLQGSPNSAYFYVFYTTERDAVQYLRVSRFVGTTQGVIGTELVMIEQELGPTLHRGGAILFGEDGFLYITIGELGWPEDAQEISGRFVGGILRIDVDQRGGDISHPVRRRLEDVGHGTSGNGYYIPSDNPFLEEDGGVFEEYFAVGARNPHRMTIDRVTGKIYIGDVGSNSGDIREEVNVLVKGANYGWPFREGTIDRPDLMPRPEDIIGLIEDPIHEYPHANGDCSVIGGYVYRGAQIPDLYGKYIFTDFCTKKVWSMDISNVPVTNKEELLLTDFNPVTLGEDGEGELYFGGLGTVPVVKLTSVPSNGEAGNAIPSLLSQTGAFMDLASLSPAQGVIPYDMNAPLWTDGAAKQRWVVIPNDGAHDSPAENVIYSEEDAFEYPIGTVFIKHFALALDERTPEVVTPIETRFLVREEDGGYYGFTYRWNAEGTDAELLESSLLDPLAITNESGTTRQQNWTFPGRSDCFTCHNQASGYVLGPKASQLNGDQFYAQTGITANQLETWNHIGIFEQSIDVAGLPGILTAKNLADGSASIEDRVRSYFDSNCASCHRPNGGPRSEFDLRLNTPLEEAGLINGEVIEDLGIEGAKVIVPGDPEKSILFHRISQLGTSTAMPPLAKNKLDEPAIALIREWIIGLEALPVELVRFEGVLDDGVVHLSWQTASETNNAGFAVERNAREDWIQVAFVNGQGTTESAYVYDYQDHVPFGVTGAVQYRLKQVDFDGAFEYSDVVELEVNPPDHIILYENYPDPFNPQTTITYDLAIDGLVTLAVYDLQGRLVKQLVNQEQIAGSYEVVFEAGGLASGTYLYRLTAGGRTQSNTMVLLK